MKAVTYHQYGPPEVLQISTVDKPVPKDNEILLKVRATGVTSGDVRLRKADPFAVRFFFGLRRPRINTLGYVIAGEVEAVGKSVTRFKIGDAVFGAAKATMGAYAQYKCLPEDGMLALKPDTMSYEEAAALPFGGTTALHFLRKGNIQRGQKILIYGASGSVGTAAVQLARYYGADVTGVTSTSNLALVKSLGAHHVIDYSTTDFSKNGEHYDIIFDTVGKSTYAKSIGSLKKRGIFLKAVHLSLGHLLRGLWTSLTTRKKVIGGVAAEMAEDVILLKDLFETGHIRAVIDKTFPLEQLADAHRYVDLGHKKGNVAITVHHQP